MSGPDAFDGEIERLFGRPPAMDGGEAFIARVEQRLNRGSRVRALVVGSAGVIGGVLAVREALDAGLGAGLTQVSQESAEATRAVSRLDWSTVLDWAQASAAGADMASLPSMPLFWLVSMALIGAVAFTALRAGDA